MSNLKQMKLLGTYQNGNYHVVLFDDGTKIRSNKFTEFIPDKPESIDLKITNCCDQSCPMCFAAGTRILMGDMTYKNIEDVRIGDTIIGFEEKVNKQGAKRKLVPAKVLKTFIHVEDELLRIETDTGNTVLTTPNHPFLSEGTGANHARNFNRIDRVKIGSNLFEYGFPHDCLDWSSNEYNLGYTIGAWVGDGCLFYGTDQHGYDAYNARFVTLDEEINDKVFETSSKFVAGLYRLDFTMSGPGARVRSSVRSNSRECYQALKELIDDHLGIEASREYAAGFLAGFCDSEGHVDNERSIVRLANTNLNYIEEVERCLAILEIDYIREVSKPQRSHYKDRYNVRIKGEYAVSAFLWYTRPVCKRKSLENYRTFCTQYHKHALISSSFVYEKQYVYNLATECHTYIANNYLVHNCHEDSTPDGPQGNILDLPFLDTMLPFSEIAIGGGNPLSHPDLEAFLTRLKQLHLIANMTVNQTHLIKEQDRVKDLIGRGLIHGLGVSVKYADLTTVRLLQEIPNAVAHIINGVIEIDQLKKMYDKGIKVLILGYKDFRRGIAAHNSLTDQRMRQLYDELPNMTKHCKVVSFDNLAIEQLDPKRLLTDEEWNEFYMGDDGQYTMYVDAVRREYAKSSVSTERWPLMDDIKPMFDKVRGQNQIDV